jgi:hypothetical protein
MSPGPTRSPHRVFIIDLRQQLIGFQEIVSDYCDDFDLVNELSLLTVTMNLLHVRDAVGEAIEAMEIHVNSFCRYEHNVFNTMRLRSVIAAYMHEMHDIFVQAGLYEHGCYLGYTFGGWIAPFEARIVPYTHMNEYPHARNTIVQSEPLSNNPLDRFPEVRDPDTIRIRFNALLRGEETIPY